MSKEDVKEEKVEKEVTEPETEKIDEEKAVDERDALIESLQSEVAKLKNDFARAYADTENMKKRLTKEADNAKKYRFKDSALELLPIVDNMAMALNVQTEDEALLNYVKGFEMIYKQFLSVLDKEADNAKKYRFQQAGLALLPIVDNMGMAIKVDSENEELTNYVKGFEMIYQQLQRVLEDEGVKEIEAEGKPFDHNTMQALMQEKQDGVESGIVLEVLQKGYMLKDRILRPALVKVSE